MASTGLVRGHNTQNVLPKMDDEGRRLTLSDHDDRGTHELLGSGLRPVLCVMWSGCASCHSHPMYIGVRVFNAHFSPSHCLGEP